MPLRWHARAPRSAHGRSAVVSSSAGGKSSTPGFQGIEIVPQPEFGSGGKGDLHDAWLSQHVGGRDGYRASGSAARAGSRPSARCRRWAFQTVRARISSGVACPPGASCRLASARAGTMPRLSVFPPICSRTLSLSPRGPFPYCPSACQQHAPTARSTASRRWSPGRGRRRCPRGGNGTVSYSCAVALRGGLRNEAYNWL